MTVLHVLALKQKEQPSFLRCRVKKVILGVTAEWLVQCKTTPYFIVRLTCSCGMGDASAST